MTDKRRSNKNSASEDEVGYIHNKTTKMWNLYLDHVLEMVQNNVVDIEAAIGDGKLLDKAGKWAADQNNVTTSLPEQDQDSELSKKLADIKKKQLEGLKDGTNNVVPFSDEEDEY